MDLTLTPDLIEHLSANEIGERLMRLAYRDAPDESRRSWRPGDFELRSDARHWGDQEACAFYGPYLDEDPRWAADRAAAVSFSEQGYDVDYCCYHDGDAILCFGVFQDGELLRAIENWDGKKDDRWRDHSSREAAPNTLAGSLLERRKAEPEPVWQATLSGRKTPLESRVYRRREALSEWLSRVWASEMSADYSEAAIFEIALDDSRTLLEVVRDPKLAALDVAPLGPRTRPSALS